MTDYELLKTLALPLADDSPWQCHNLKPSATADGDVLSFQVQNASVNGHLDYTTGGGDWAGGRLSVTVPLWADESGQVGVNVYLHFNPDDPSDRKVYQLHHPGDGAWHTLHRDILCPAQPIAEIRLLIVARVGASGFRIAEASLCFRNYEGDDHGALLQHNHISQAYFEAVEALVDAHPSAGDRAFRDKLTGYLLGTNRNGMAHLTKVVEGLRSDDVGLDGRRFLDLGSGSGGSLVAALKAGAAYAEGWEINADKRRLAEVNVRTCGVDPDRVSVRDQNMENPEAADESTDPFDLVFCEEVLEHVKDLDGAFATLSRCIRPDGGVGYVTIPNGFALSSVFSDPHLQLFGIALLDRFEAQPLATALKNHTHYSDMMGTYCTFGEYVRRFDDVGLAVESVEEGDASAEAVEGWREQLADLEVRRATLRQDWGDRVDGDTLTLLEARLDDYLRSAWKRLEGVGDSADAREAFARDYGQGHFSFLVRHR